MLPAITIKNHLNATDMPIDPIVKAIINFDVDSLKDVIGSTEKLIDRELENMPTVVKEAVKEAIEQYGIDAVARYYIGEAHKYMVEERHRRENVEWVLAVASVAD